MNILKPKADSSIIVFGLGTVGLTAVMAAKYLGLRQIIAVDIQDSKLPIAKELGATDVINSRGIDDIVGHLKQLTGGGADYCMDATGVPQVIENMLDCLGMLGTAAIVGVPPTGSKVTLDPLQYLLGSKSCVGCREGDSVPVEFIPKLVESTYNIEYGVVNARADPTQCKDKAFSLLRSWLRLTTIETLGRLWRICIMVGSLNQSYIGRKNKQRTTSSIQM